uniref:Putative extracellular protein CSOL_075 n=1 Tax=Pseudococcomyxa simplex TaxID=464287 RepID=A0A7L9QE77_9CHLO|nr:putative extracellular protein CSOL_075 [Pseudococcomyxa simplex]
MRTRLVACTSTCVLLVVLLTGAGSQSSSNPPEINSSILLVGPGDYAASGGTSRCIQMVQKAAGNRQSRLMFTPTLFWVDKNFQQRKSVNSQGNVTYYCYSRQAGGVCPQATAADIQGFQSGMAACFQKAIDLGLSTIAVAPHLDDGLGYGGWRNGLLFDPAKKYGNYSYADIMLNPLADALAQVATSSTRIYLAMQGEMSATVFYFPASYVRLLPVLRRRLSAGSASSGNIKLGVSTNFDKLCGCVLQDMVDPSQYLQQFPAAFAPLKSRFDLTSLSTLYSSVDFIGISAYPSLKPNFTTNQIESATQQFDLEIKNFGIDIKDLIFNQGKELFWNEYGVGGGSSQDGNTPATTAAQAAATPFFGVFGAYTLARDPWKTTEVRSYNHYFYRKTLEYLDSRGTCSGCQYRVDGVFIWNDASWDIQGIYPESTTSEGTYRDTYLVNLFNQHNARAIGGSAGSAVSSASVSTGDVPSPSPDTTAASTAASTSPSTAPSTPVPAATLPPLMAANAASPSVMPSSSPLPSPSSSPLPSNSPAVQTYQSTYQDPGPFGGGPGGGGPGGGGPGGVGPFGGGGPFRFPPFG